MPYTVDQFTNYAVTSVAGGTAGRGTPLQAADTTLYVPIGDGAKLPQPTGGSTFRLQIGASELVIVTGRSGDTLTIVRGAEGTTAQTAQVGTTVQLAVTAASMSDLWTAVNSGRAYYVDDYGAKGDGVTDDTTAIQAAENAASAAGGGLVVFAGKTYISQTITKLSNVYWRGAGAKATILRLKNSTNADLVNGGSTNLTFINVTNTTVGNGNTGGVADWGIADMTLDGNKANQSGTSYTLRVYGLNFRLRDCNFINGLTGNVLLDWNGGSTPAGEDGMEGKITGCKLRGAGGVNLILAGPHDSSVSDTQFESSGSHNIYIGPHAVAPQFTQIHAWGSAQGNNSVPVLCEVEQCHFTGCEVEGGDGPQVVLLSRRNSYVGGSIFGLSTPGTTSSGIQFGQAAGLTPYAGSAFQSAGLTTAVAAYDNLIDTHIFNCYGSNGALWFANDGGNNIRANIETNAGSGTVQTGTVSANTMLDYTVYDITGALNHHLFATPGYHAVGAQLNANAQTIANNGTIQPSGVEAVIVTAAANVTGVILPNGIYHGQLLAVVNKSAFTLTMDVSGTSHVADGVSDVIAANRGALYIWIIGPNLWYRLG